MAKKKTSKPKPISMKVAKKPKQKKAPTPPPVEDAPKPFNDVSSITSAQMKRAERAIENLVTDVKELRARKPEIKVSSPEPKVEVVLPSRPRIARVRVRYDNFGVPSEFIPVYEEV